LRSRGGITAARKQEQEEGCYFDGAVLHRN